VKSTKAPFCPVRQVYHSLILAEWYKRKIKQSFITAAYVDRIKVAGLEQEQGAGTGNLCATASLLRAPCSMPMLNALIRSGKSTSRPSRRERTVFIREEKDASFRRKPHPAQVCLRRFQSGLFYPTTACFPDTTTAPQLPVGLSDSAMVVQTSLNPAVDNANSRQQQCCRSCDADRS